MTIMMSKKRERERENFKWMVLYINIFETL